MVGSGCSITGGDDGEGACQNQHRSQKEKKEDGSTAALTPHKILATYPLRPLLKGVFFFFWSVVEKPINSQRSGGDDKTELPRENFIEKNDGRMDKTSREGPTILEGLTNGQLEGESQTSISKYSMVPVGIRQTMSLEKRSRRVGKWANRGKVFRAGTP